MRNFGIVVNFPFSKQIIARTSGQSGEKTPEKILPVLAEPRPNYGKGTFVTKDECPNESCRFFTRRIIMFSFPRVSADLGKCSHDSDPQESRMNPFYLQFHLAKRYNPILRPSGRMEIHFPRGLGRSRVFPRHISQL